MADKKSSPQQIAQSVYDPDSDAISIKDVTNLVPSEYNEINFVYENTNPEPSTVTYLLNGEIVAVINFTYDIRGRVERVFRSA